MQRLTYAERRVMRAVVAHLRDNGFPPTVREIVERLGYRRGNGRVAERLRCCADKGYLRIAEGLSRAITLTTDPADIELRCFAPNNFADSAGRWPAQLRLVSGQTWQRVKVDFWRDPHEID